MVDEEKLIKQGIRLTEAWFKKFKKQIEHDLSICETYEEFLERTKEYTTNNILIGSGYAEEMGALIALAITNSQSMRASKRALVEQVIRNNVGLLIKDVGEDIKETVRDEVSKGYDEGLHARDISKRLNEKIDIINSKRARTIARTEVNRTQTISEYIIHKERGAKGFTVVCRPDCCPLCAKDYADINDPNYTLNYKRIQNLTNQLKRNPRREDANQIKAELEELEDSQNNITGSDGGRLIGDEKRFSMTDTKMLPPRHPNCRCSVNYFY
jgi:NAD-dependent dihydropyrimidine dehydrogenase PreA subunit